MKYIKKIVFIISMVFGISIPANAIQLTGTMVVDRGILERVEVRPGVFINKYISGSYFALGGNTPTANSAMLQPGSDPGIILGSFQGFTPNPDEPHPAGHPDAPFGAGTGYSAMTTSSNVFKPFNFFSSATFIGLNEVSYQSGETKPAPSAEVDLTSCVGTVCDMFVEMSVFEVYWNGAVFEQGPRPSNSGPFVLGQGTYDTATRRYSVTWVSQIKGGPFSNVPGWWHLEGEVLPEPLVADVLVEPRTLNVKSNGNGFTVTIGLQDTDGSIVSASGAEEGVMISAVGDVTIPDSVITENVAARTINGDEITVVFNDPATGSRQDVIAAVSDLEDGSVVDVCVKGVALDANGSIRPFTGCSSITIKNKGSR